MEREPRQHIAAEIRAEVARQRKRQHEMASVLGLTQQGLSLKLNGFRPFTAEELAQLAIFLCVSVEQFMPQPVEAAR